MARYIDFRKTDWPFIEDLRRDDSLPFIHFPEEYHGEEKLKLCCTQISGLSDYQQKKVTDKWAEYLSAEKLPVKFLQCCTATPQRIFDAICTQGSIEVLRLKWGRFNDLSAITKLKDLRALHIDMASSVEDLTPIGELEHLEYLFLDNVKKTQDFSAIGKLSGLTALHICVGMWEWLTEVESADFLLELKKLRYLSLGAVRFADGTALRKLNPEKFDYFFIRLEDEMV